MGKKTNWTVSEDQALCRAWLCASDSTFVHGNDQKAGTFWGVVHQLFHAELETSVDRPVTGLKIRWTRINRDVQKFALVFSRVLGSRAPSDTAEIDVERERQFVDESADLYLKEQGSKFAFENCWRLLRFSPRWLQLLASAGGTIGSLEGQTSFVLLEQASAANASADSSVIGSKRRFASLADSQARSLLEASSSVDAIVAELKRQSSLLEEQNAIALFRMELELIEDDVARQYFRELQQTYVKRMRGVQSLQNETESHDEDREGEDFDAVARDGKETANL